MKFLLDQNVERRFAHWLKHLGHDVTIVAVDYPAGIPDTEVLTFAFTEQRILVTHDRSDFGELIFRYHKPHCGVILFHRIRSGDIATKQKRFLFVLAHYTHQLQHFLVVTPERVRVRKRRTKQAA